MTARPAASDGLVTVPLELEGAKALVTTRAGGVSLPPYDTANLGDHVGDVPPAVRENRRRLAAAMGVADVDLVVARQVHGAGVAVVEAGWAGGEADAVVTSDRRVAIAVLVADCVPLAVVDPEAGVLAVVHAGWRGVVAGVVPATLDVLVARGAAPWRCRAALGPCVSARTYQVGDDVARALAGAAGDDVVRPDGTGRYLADLAGAVTAQLVRGGVRAAAVAAPTAWTDGGEQFFSDRAHRPCGRFALAARLAGDGS